MSADVLPRRDDFVREIGSRSSSTVNRVLSTLACDEVALVRSLRMRDAERTLLDIADALGLAQKLEAQSAFASFQGHRQNVGRRFTTVNTRRDYEYITPHSEGTSDMGIQLAAFYCRNNTTDGGETALFHTSSGSLERSGLRQLCVCLDTEGRVLSESEKNVLRAKYGAGVLTAQVAEGDIIHSELDAGASLPRAFRVLKPIIPTLSSILRVPLYAYWDNVSSIDLECARGFSSLMHKNGLLKTPLDDADAEKMDNARHRRLWQSGFHLDQVSDHFSIIKMCEGDLIVVNNLSWAHAVANWSPGSGCRDVLAAFA